MYSDSESTKEQVAGAIETLLSSTKGCTLDKLNQVYKMILRNKINPLIERLKEN